jgi:hypothetical protein
MCKCIDIYNIKVAEGCWFPDGFSIHLHSPTKTPFPVIVDGHNYLQKTVNSVSPFQEKPNTPVLRRNTHFAGSAKTLTDVIWRQNSARISRFASSYNASVW